MSGVVVRRPEDAARSWPEDARAVALITSGEDEGIPFAALDLMEELAERWRPALLVGLGAGARLPDEGEWEADGPGLTAVIRGDATLKEAARARPDRSFAFLPAGEDAEVREILESRPLGRLAEAVRDAGGILVLHVPGSVEAPPPEWLDGRLLVGSAAAEGPPPAWAGLADLGGLADEGSAQEVEDETPAGRWRRHRKDPGVPVARLAAALVGIAVIVGGWWLLARESIDLPEAGPPSAAVDTTAAAASAAGPDTGGEAAVPDTATASRDDTAAARSGGMSGEEGAAPEATDLAYSVLVASYQRADDAARRVERLRESVTVPVFASPTRVGGRVYHRVFAGARADTASAGELMRSLADRGLKRSVSGWDLRPARWSLLLGRYEAQAAARRARGELGGSAVHAYILPEPTEGDTAYLLYAGAFESSEAAGTLLQELRESGQTANVMMRRGEPR